MPFQQYCAHCAEMAVGIAASQRERWEIDGIDEEMFGADYQSQGETWEINEIDEDMLSILDRPRQHISFPPSEELPHKDTTPSSSRPSTPEGSILRGRPTHQCQGSSRSSNHKTRAPSPYPGRGRRQVSFAVSFGSSLETQHEETAPPSPPSSASSEGSILRGRPTHQRPSGRNNRRSRAPSPHPEKRRPLVTFQNFWEMPAKTGLPNLELPSHQAQCKKGGSPEASPRSRAASPHPSSRAHRKEILQELEASRTGLKDGLRHQTTRMNHYPWTMLGPLNGNHNNATNSALGSNMDTRPIRDTSIPSDSTATEPALEEQQQENEQVEDTEEFWDACDDFNDAQVPQSDYDAEEVESTEPRRTKGWFSRWFGVASRG